MKFYRIHLSADTIAAGETPEEAKNNVVSYIEGHDERAGLCVKLEVDSLDYELTCSCEDEFIPDHSVWIIGYGWYDK